MQRSAYILFCVVVFIYANEILKIPVYISETSHGVLLHLNNFIDLMNPRCSIFYNGSDNPVYISTKTCQIRFKSGKSFDYEKQISYFFIVKAFPETSLLRKLFVMSFFMVPMGRHYSFCLFARYL